MIRNFVNKGLEKFHNKGLVSKIHPQHRNRVRRILDMLESAELLEDLNVPGFTLHQLLGKPTRHSMKVKNNWVITFEWKNGKAHQIDYEDYH